VHGDPLAPCFRRLPRLGLWLPGAADGALDEESSEADPRRTVGGGDDERRPRRRSVAVVERLDLVDERLGLGGRHRLGASAHHEGFALCEGAS